MILKLKENKIQRAFSRSATRYEKLAGLQERIGDSLIHKIRHTAFPQYVLDIGMGTGCLTQRLKVLWPQACVVGMDFASGMVACAREKYDTLRFVQADASRLPFKNENFDLVFSNLAYQWVDDLSRAFSLAYDVLKPGGSFYLSVFTRHSLKELFISLQNACGQQNGRRELKIRRLPEQQEVIDAIAGAGFHISDSETQIYRIYFDDMMALLKWLKDIGANAAPRQFFVGKDALLKADAYHRKFFKEYLRIFVSFEVVTIAARKS